MINKVKFKWSSCFEVKEKIELKFMNSENATKFCEISTLLLTAVHTVKIKVEISQNFVAFSEYMNFIFKFFQRISRIHRYLFLIG